MGRWACPRDRMHRLTRDSFAGAACAGPKAHTRPLATRAKTCARRQFRGREARTMAIVAVKQEVQRLQKGVRFGLGRAQPAPASASMAAATSDGKPSARRNAWPIRETSSCRAAI